MFFIYLREVLKRAFTPTPRLTDGLQILAASALPAIANFAGIDLPRSTESQVLAYIGLAALSYFAIRLVWAPYAMWKDQIHEGARLRRELDEPDHKIRVSQAQRIADNRLRLAGAIWEDYSHLMGVMIGERDKLGKKHGKESFRLAAETEFGLAFISARAEMHSIAVRVDEGTYTEDDRKRLTRVVTAIIEYLHGTITAEVLALRLPKDIEQETPL